MEDSGCPRRRRSVRFWMVSMLLASGTWCFGQAVTIAPRWQVSYPPAANGRASESTAVPVPGESNLVAVVLAGADAFNPTVRLGNRLVPVQVIGHDPVSRLGFFKVEGSLAPKNVAWLQDSGGGTSTNGWSLRTQPAT